MHPNHLVQVLARKLIQFKNKIELARDHDFLKKLSLIQASIDLYENESQQPVKISPIISHINSSVTQTIQSTISYQKNREHLKTENTITIDKERSNSRCETLEFSSKPRQRIIYDCVSLKPKESLLGQGKYHQMMDGMVDENGILKEVKKEDTKSLVFPRSLEQHQNGNK